MENEFLDKIEDNAAVRIWSEKTQLEKGDSLIEGHASELWDFTLVIFGILYFTFGKVELVPTVEEYTALLRCLRIQTDKAYSRAVNVPTFVKKLMNITGMSEQWVIARIKQKGENEAVTDLFDRLDRRVTLVLAILAKTFRSLNASIGYTPLLVLRQYKSRQFIPATQGLAQCEFSYKGDTYKKKIREMSNTWNQTRRMKRFTVGLMMTPEYNGWWSKRVNDNIPEPSQKGIRSMEEYLQVVPSEIEIIKQDFEKRNSELGKKIKQLEEEKIHLRLDVDVQKLETEKLRKGKNKAEEDLDSLKTDYKKLRLSMRIAEWERKFQEAQTRNEALEKSLSESQNEKGELKARVAELEKSLHHYRNHNSAMELRASLSKIEGMKRRVEELEAALQNCEIQIELLEASGECQKEKLHFFQNQVRNIYHIIGEVVAQIREVADHWQTLAVHVDILSVKYELESDRGQELASLLRKIKFLSIRLAEIQQDMMDKMLESQRNMMTQLTQLLVGGIDKGKGQMANPGVDNEEPLYPPSFTPPNTQAQAEMYPQRPSVTIRPQQFQAGASMPMNFQAGSGHLIENRTAFKKLVERLINIDIVKFDDPSNEENLLPNYIDNGVKVMSEDRRRRIKTNIVEVKTPLRWV
ncbi:hypothetical protein Gotur_017563 [Gossypium turneri]